METCIESPWYKSYSLRARDNSSPFRSSISKLPETDHDGMGSTRPLSAHIPVNLNSDVEVAVAEPPPSLSADAIGGSLTPSEIRISEETATSDLSTVKPSSLVVITADWALNLYSHVPGNTTLKGTSSTIDPVLGRSNNRICLSSPKPVRLARSDHPQGRSSSIGPIPIPIGVNSI